MEGAMRLSRLLILLTGCFLAASAAWADELGYVDCATHPENAQVFAKARQSQDVVASVPCGERFTVLLYGFIFSRVQTKDGKIGYVYSNVISADRAANSGQRSAPAQPAQPMQSVSIREAVPAKPAATAPTATTSPAPAQPQPLTAQPASAQASVAIAQPAAATVAPASIAPSASASANVQTTTATAPSPAPPAPVEVQPAAPPPAAAPSAPAPSLPTAAQVEAATSASATQPVSSVSDLASAPASEPASTQPASQPEPQPAAAQPEPAPVRSNPSVRSSWEKPLPGGRRQTFLLDLFSGYAFARFVSNSGGYSSATNLNGAMGSVGWNFKPWLQIVGDSSFNFVTVSGVKNKLYGNHFGARYFYRSHFRWSITPFAEALVGGSRLDASISGGGSTSTNCISYKAGGGVDVSVGRRWSVRVIDVDFYRTSFSVGGVSAWQNSYWASAGVVLRLFGSPGE